ncbi:hypothetical protein ASPZODRAFT_25410 [Penicilliopsis zonata CBS 506.65]|uniref:Uncharacterized protein n=1 Tax=Penicilliopsis zonata CBS 506.65 TaxID=1073090 RepID=A0A1L9SJE3_9EURO|nr:hypothetical protein ASPZODRAFT_25410 [Penicilliopsis zonata CBS 506.65]OJJ47352.1 hypothetical protein ASPZODRAFT_25410 [Penicilliopsis zonata CBS 506.65]
MDTLFLLYISPWLVLAVFTAVSLFSLLRVLFTSRQLVSLSDTPSTVIGKPLLFPVTFNHKRFTPAKDRFTNQFLFVGVPVGLKCRIGNFLAVDDPSLDLYSSFSLKRIFSHLSCWFSFDSRRYLHRGDQVDLRDKLDEYLLSIDEKPSQWPHAYLLGVPQFLGFSRAVVSYWYLYNAEKELDAVILEINNSYWEKRNVFLRLNGSGKAANNEDKEHYLDALHLIQSLPSSPHSNFYQGTWDKKIFASPFEKVDGQVSNRFMDPLQPASWKPNASFANMTTLDETSGTVKMVTRMTCSGLPIDPCEMSAWQVLCFVLRWTLPGMLTTGYIVFHALRIRFTLMRMMKKPPVRMGSVGRYPTKNELNLEKIFRAYLASCVERCSSPVKVEYLPCRAMNSDTVYMTSPSYNEKEGQTITVEPADPGFYTRFAHYENVRTAIMEEIQLTNHEADPTARRLLLSHPDLMAEILTISSSNA